MKHRFSFHAESVCVCWCSSFWVSAVFGCLLNFGWHWQDAKTRLLHTHTLTQHRYAILNTLTWILCIYSPIRRRCSGVAWLRPTIITSEDENSYKRKAVRCEWCKWFGPMDEKNRITLRRKKNPIHCSPRCWTWSLIAISIFSLFFLLLGILLMRHYCPELQCFVIIILRMMGFRKSASRPAGQLEATMEMIKKWIYFSEERRLF